MNNLEKMNELVSSDATKEQIKDWAYMNRILITNLEFEEEFETMKNSVNVFIESEDFSEECSELELWDRFLDANYKETNY